MSQSPLNPQEVQQQLTTLSKGRTHNFGKNLYAILQQLNAEDHAFQTTNEILELLREPLFQCTNSLEKAFTLATYPLPPNFRKMAKLCVFLHYELAQGYESLLTHSENQDLSFQASFAQKALLSLGRVLLHMVQMGEAVSSSLWRRHNAVFLLGRQQDWLRQNVHDPVLGKQAILSPFDQFKCNAAFMALLPTRFDPFSARRLFDFVLQNNHLIDTNPKDKQNVWTIEPAQNEGPTPNTSGQPEDPAQLRFSFHPPETLLLPQAMTEQLTRYAGARASIQNYPMKRQVREVWIGWHTIEKELDRYHGSRENESHWLQVPDFELAPDGSEIPHSEDFPSPLNAGEKKRRTLVKRWVEYSLLSNKENDFALLDADDKLLERGDLVVLKMLDESFIIAAVRWIQPGIRMNRTLYGLECFSGKMEKMLVQLPKQWLDIPGILIKERKELLLPPVKIKHATTIEVGQTTYTVTRLLEWGTDFCAYQLTH
ncbi:MAG: hypothetical protein AXA67_02935 [Methylothermaceae bacteria B42]|nr:MAG: hypothetical protein AXA67_02935 [Methylothermaceae bacteria B42]HHJ38761.1 hypothetical protein [Methylothermaceae bacterium]